MCYMSENVESDTKTVGGLYKGMQRWFAGESFFTNRQVRGQGAVEEACVDSSFFFLSFLFCFAILLEISFVNTGSRPGYVGFATPVPGHIIPIDLRDFGGEFLCQRDAYICHMGELNVGLAFQKKMTVGLFGGEGFMLQKLQGTGLGFISASGTGS